MFEAASCVMRKTLLVIRAERESYEAIYQRDRVAKWRTQIQHLLRSVCPGCHDQGFSWNQRLLLFSRFWPCTKGTEVLFVLMWTWKRRFGFLYIILRRIVLRLFMLEQLILSLIMLRIMLRLECWPRFFNLILKLILVILE